jgi:hypothetical protein
MDETCMVKSGHARLANPKDGGSGGGSGGGAEKNPQRHGWEAIM